MHFYKKTQVKDSMRYQSTRGGVKDVDFSEIVFSNYAPDGGLFVPQYIPQIPRTTLASWSKLTYPQLCAKVLSYYVNDDIRAQLPRLCANAYSHFDTSSVVPVLKISSIYIMELFHGPTLGFVSFIFSKSFSVALSDLSHIRSDTMAL